MADRIEFILGDYISFAESYLQKESVYGSPAKRKIDVVFLSPPWGGPSYLNGTASSLPSPIKPSNGVNGDLHNNESLPHPSYSLSSIQPIHGAEVFHLTRRITPNVAYYLPRNTDLQEIGALLISDAEDENVKQKEVAELVEVEEEWMGNKLKALTCYFGGLVAGQEHLF